MGKKKKKEILEHANVMAQAMHCQALHSPQVLK